jgi:hypothetical protein
MTTAQKNAKAKFKQAIEYRKKTGVSLKEAFAHIYGKKKVGSVAKKTVKKKKAKLTTEDKKDKSAFNAMARKHKKARVGALKLKPNEMRLGLLSSKVGASVKKKSAKKKPSEQSILNKIHIVKKGVDKLDEAQHRHMMNGVGTTQNILKDISKLDHDINTYKYWIDIFKKVGRQAKAYGLSSIEIKQLGNNIKKYRLLIKEKETHLRELKKHL